MKKEFQPEQKKSPIQRIAESPCAKFEYCESKEGEVFITSEIFMLSSTFSSLDLMESDIPVTEWIYRITFNCAEKFLGDDEIVVLIGDRAMSINGESYTTPENVPFEEVVDLFASKYKYFINSYFDDQGENSN